MKITPDSERARGLELLRQVRASESRRPLSEAVRKQTEKAFAFSTSFDIETGDLNRQSPIYELGFLHEGKDPVVAFGKPTEIVGGRQAAFSPFTRAKLKERFGSLFNARATFNQEGLKQKDIPAFALSQLQGRDVWVQNLPFERSFISQRMDKGQFATWAKSAKLESFVGDSGLYPTSPGLKRALHKANVNQSTLSSLDNYLQSWEGVFGEIHSSLSGPRIEGSTRVFDLMDLTRSVFAMAQSRGVMPKTGELFAGSSIEALSQAIFQIPEPHSALGDAVLQGEIAKYMYATGLSLKEGTLSEHQRGVFRQIGAAQPHIKQAGATKNIIDTFVAQQKYTSSLDPEDLSSATIGAQTELRTGRMQVLQPDGSYSEESFSFTQRRRGDSTRTTTDIKSFIKGRAEEQSLRHGIKVDYDAAHKAARSLFIDQYEETLRGVGWNSSEALGRTRDALAGAEETLSEGTRKVLSQAPPPDPSGGAFGAIKSRWKLGAGVLGGLALLGYAFSGSDDEYNYIEGLRHTGFSGESRALNTDFGSGWRGLERVGARIYKVPNHLFSNMSFILSQNNPVPPLGFADFLDRLTRKRAAFVGRRGVDPAWKAAGEEIKRFEEAIRARKESSFGAISDESVRLSADIEGISYSEAQRQIVEHEEVHALLPIEYTHKLQKESRFLSRNGHGITKGRWWTPRTLLLEEMAAFQRDGTPISSLPGAERVPKPFRDLVDSVVALTEEQVARDRLGKPLLSRFSAFDDAYNVIEGLRHEGVAGATRKLLTDFGSGWRGLIGYSARLGEDLTPRREAALDILGFVTSSRASDKAGFYNRVPATIQKEMDLSVAGGQEYPVFINRDVFIQKENAFRDISGALAGISSMERGAEAAMGRSWWQRLFNRGQLARSRARIKSVAETQADLVTPGEQIKATILHERFHQRVQNDIEAYREVKGAVVPEEFAKIFREVDYGPEALIAEEYLAHKKQFERYPRTLRRSPFRTVFEGSSPDRPASNTSGNTISGLPENGVAGAARKGNTNFGSPWQGQGRIDDENASRLSKRQTLGLNPNFQGSVGVSDIPSYRVEDADTVQAMFFLGSDVSLRLAGIDAPETEHEGLLGRILQDQPYGRAAAERLNEILSQQKSVKAVFDPNAESTYGRAPAILLGDNGVNINLQLVQEGYAAALPFGSSESRLADTNEFRAAQREAQEAGRGMWEDEGWQAVYRAQSQAKKKLTHTSLTQLDRVAENFRTAGALLRLQNPDEDFSQMMAGGGKDDFNIIEGLRHGWAQGNRELNIGDFGSGYIIDKTVNVMKKNTRVRQQLMKGQALARSQCKAMMDPQNWTKHHVG